MSGLSKERVDQLIRPIVEDHSLIRVGDRPFAETLLRDLIAQVEREAAWVTCEKCGGSGVASREHKLYMESECGVPAGGPTPCPDCGGTGEVSRERVAELELAEKVVEEYGPRHYTTIADVSDRIRRKSDNRETERRKAREEA
jgi:hypothetical protein